MTRRLSLIALASAALLFACDKDKAAGPEKVAVASGANTAAPAVKAGEAAATAKAGAAAATAKAGAAVATAKAGASAATVTTAKAAADDAPSCGADCPGKAAKLAAGDDYVSCGSANNLAAADKAPKTHFGSTFTLKDSTPLGKVVTTAKGEPSELLQVSGKVKKVCKKKGCWMVVQDGETEARVVMKGYSFFVPVDTKSGIDAVVEGTLKVKTFTEKQAKHLAEDGGDDPNKVTGVKKEYLLTANAIRFDS